MHIIQKMHKNNEKNRKIHKNKLQHQIHVYEWKYIKKTQKRHQKQQVLKYYYLLPYNKAQVAAKHVLHLQNLIHT